MEKKKTLRHVDGAVFLFEVESQEQVVAFENAMRNDVREIVVYEESEYHRWRKSWKIWLLSKFKRSQATINLTFLLLLE